jgi:hypothetical protein
MMDTDVLIAVAILCIGIFGAVGGLLVSNQHTHTAHTYTVKTEQVETLQDDQQIVTYDELEPDMKKALHTAFKKQDHFFGSASIEIEVYDGELAIDSGWKTVNVDGAVFLVSVQGPSEVTYYDALGVIGIFVSIVSVAISFVAGIETVSRVNSK